MGWERRGAGHGRAQGRRQQLLGYRCPARGTKGSRPRRETRPRGPPNCFEHARLIRIYAFWRTLSRHDFNARFSPLELGFFGATGRQINLSNQAILSAKPGDRPFVYDDTPTTLASGEIVMAQKRPLGKSWSEVLRDLPIGSQLVWTNADAYRRCTRNPSLNFCEAWRDENATKVGQDRYAAHPFGVIDEATIKRKMAEAVTGEGNVPRGYIARNIYISAAIPPQ